MFCFCSKSCVRLTKGSHYTLSTVLRTNLDLDSFPASLSELGNLTNPPTLPILQSPWSDNIDNNCLHKLKSSATAMAARARAKPFNSFFRGIETVTGGLLVVVGTGQVRVNVQITGFTPTPVLQWYSVTLSVTGFTPTPYKNPPPFRSLDIIEFHRLLPSFDQIFLYFSEP